MPVSTASSSGHGKKWCRSEGTLLNIPNSLLPTFLIFRFAKPLQRVGCPRFESIHTINALYQEVHLVFLAAAQVLCTIALEQFIEPFLVTR